MSLYVSGCLLQPSILGGHFSVLIWLVHFRNSTRSSNCCSVKLNCGIWRRPSAWGGLRLDPGFDEVRATTGVHVAQLGGKVSALTQQRVTANAIARFPQFFARDDGRGDGLGVRALRYSSLTVKNKRDKHEDEEHTPPVEHVAGHLFGKPARFDLIHISSAHGLKIRRQVRCDDEIIP